MKKDTQSVNNWPAAAPRLACSPTQPTETPKANRNSLDDWFNTSIINMQTKISSTVLPVLLNCLLASLIFVSWNMSCARKTNATDVHVTTKINKYIYIYIVNYNTVTEHHYIESIKVDFLNFCSPWSWKLRKGHQPPHRGQRSWETHEVLGYVPYWEQEQKIDKLTLLFLATLKSKSLLTGGRIKNSKRFVPKSVAHIP